MTIHNLNFECVTAHKSEAQPPLIIDTDAMTTAAVAFQRLKSVRWRLAKIVQPLRGIQLL